MNAIAAELLALAIQDGPAFVSAITQMFAANGKTEVTDADWAILRAAQAPQTAVIQAPIPGEDDGALP